MRARNEVVGYREPTDTCCSAAAPRPKKRVLPGAYPASDCRLRGSVKMLPAPPPEMATKCVHLLRARRKRRCGKKTSTSGARFGTRRRKAPRETHQSQRSTPRKSGWGRRTTAGFGAPRPPTALATSVTQKGQRRTKPWRGELPTVLACASTDTAVVQFCRQSRQSAPKTNRKMAGMIESAQIQKPGERARPPRIKQYSLLWPFT